LTATIAVKTDHPLGPPAEGVAKHARIATNSAPGTAPASGAAGAPNTATLLPSVMLFNAAYRRRRKRQSSQPSTDSAASVRSLKRCTLPLGVRGSSSTKCTTCGYS
jgi:hypothetical protein